ncbi:MAG: hypothetical protein CVU91_01000 [Firmicutes bacterium HGW-Firmicutes-16]|nr:MAG: hypothetical protein CVU91_01000 [Firmicutes bacterium HGW-Firmicutes-16]
MRISDRQTARDYLKYLDKAKTNYAETNARIASGNRFTSISDDVSAATKALRVRVEKAKSEEYYGNVKAVNEQLSTTENALTSINGVLSGAHSKVLAAMNSTSGESGRAAIANEIGSVRDEILQFANTKYNDAFVLGGSSAGKAPFSTDSSGNLLYNGIDVNIIEKDSAGYYYMDGADRKEIPMNGDTYVDIGLGITMSGSIVRSDTAMKTSYSGLEILGFGKDADGNPNNVFNMLTKLKDSIKNYDAETVGNYDDKLVSFTTNFRGYLTDIGAKTSFLDTIEKRVSTTIDTYQSQISRLVGVNDAEEATNQSMNDYVLKAVLSMGSKIIPTSLMDFLN